MRIYRPQSKRKIIRLKPRKAPITAGGALVKVLTTRGSTPTATLSKVKPIRFSFR